MLKPQGLLEIKYNSKYDKSVSFNVETAENINHKLSDITNHRYLLSDSY